MTPAVTRVQDMPKIAIQIEPMWGFEFHEIRAIAEACERSGWDALWVSDHIFLGGDAVDRNCYEAWTLLAALAPVTNTLRLGTLVTCNSYRHPALLAKMAAGIDDMTGGRLDFGIGAGWNEPECTVMGGDFDHRWTQTTEAIEVMKKL